MGEVQEGEEVRSGLGVMDVIDPSAMRVRVKINQADVSALRIGQPARITLDSYPTRTFTGRLEQMSQIGAVSTMSNRVRSFLAIFSIDGSDPHLMPDLAAAIDITDPREAAPEVRRLAMSRGAALSGLVVVVGCGAPRCVAAARRRCRAIVTKTTFVDFLQLRGDIKAVRSVVLTAPSTGADLQIVELATNGAKVAAGEVIVTFDPTVQQRTLETKQSELKQADSEIERTEAEQRRRVAAAQSELEEAKKALGRARLEIQGNELRARLEAEKFILAVSDAEEHVRELEKRSKASGSRRRPTWPSLARSARGPLRRAGHGAYSRVAADSRADRWIHLAAAEFRAADRPSRAGVPTRRSSMVRRAARRAAGPHRSAADRARG
jgi:multidrug efflux pump subunit AcrA (membrane-fusion protein)